MQSKTKRPKQTPKPQEKKEPEDLAAAEQPLFFYGPPPALLPLYTNSGFDKSIHPESLLKMMRLGCTRSEVCASWGITYGTFNDWLEQYPELAEAFVIGKPAFDAYYKVALRASAFGQAKTIREGSLFFYLKNVAGFDDAGGSHEFSDSTNAELDIVGEDG